MDCSDRGKIILGVGLQDSGSREEAARGELTSHIWNTEGM